MHVGSRAFIVQYSTKLSFLSIQLKIYIEKEKYKISPWVFIKCIHFFLSLDVELQIIINPCELFYTQDKWNFILIFKRLENKGGGVEITQF